MADLARVAQTVAAAAHGPAVGLLDRLCAACVRALPLEGAAISMMADVDRPVARSASDERVSRLEELQFTLGEGPGVAAFNDRAPACVRDLLAVDASCPMFTSEAAALVDRAGWEIRSVFALPLNLGPGEPLGVVDLYQRVSGEPNAQLLAQARIAVDAVAMALFAAAAEAGTEAGGERAWLPHLLADRVELDQAVGMVMAQLDLASGEALARMRGRAFAQGRTVDEVARAVIARTLRFTGEDGSDPDGTGERA